MNEEMDSGKSCKLIELTPEQCMEYVQGLAELLVPAFRHSAGEIDVWTALKECALGRMTCIVGEINGVVNMAVILSICEYPLKRVCDVVAYAGRVKDYYSYMPVVENWARARGAVEMRGYGTEAAMRLARMHHGYEEVYRVYKKDLTGKEVK